MIHGFLIWKKYLFGRKKQMINVYETIMKPENKDFIKSLFSIDTKTGLFEINEQRYCDEIVKYPGLELPMVAIDTHSIVDEKGFRMSAKTNIARYEFVELLQRIKLFDGTGKIKMDNVMTALVNHSKIPVAVLVVSTKNAILHNPKTGEIHKLIPINVCLDHVNNNAYTLAYKSLLSALPSKLDPKYLTVKYTKQVVSNTDDFVESVFWYSLQNVYALEYIIEQLQESDEYEGWELIDKGSYTKKFEDDLDFVKSTILSTI